MANQELAQGDVRMLAPFLHAIKILQKPAITFSISTNAICYVSSLAPALRHLLLPHKCAQVLPEFLFMYKIKES